MESNGPAKDRLCLCPKIFNFRMLVSTVVSSSKMLAYSRAIGEHI